MATPIRQEPIEAVVATLEEQSTALPEVAQKIIEMRRNYEAQIAELRQQVAQLSLEKQQLTVELDRERKGVAAIHERIGKWTKMAQEHLNETSYSS